MIMTPSTNAEQSNCNSKNIIIALDGPAGSGKSTTAQRVAHHLEYLYIDTGAMYRAVTLAALRENAAFTDEGMKPILATNFIRLAANDDERMPNMFGAHFGGQRTYLNDEDVSDEIRSQDVTMQVSAVSALQSVREEMVEQQRAMGAGGGVVMDGRDIGTVVFPQAELKVFLIASVKERAKRRLRELQAKQNTVVPSFEELCKQLQERDRQDSEREIAPLRKADDAIEIDTSTLTIDEQTARIVALAHQTIQRL